MSLISSIFGCGHVNTSRVFTIRRETYIVCLDCGRKFDYDLELMQIAEPRAPELERIFELR